MLSDPNVLHGLIDELHKIAGFEKLVGLASRLKTDKVLRGKAIFGTGLVAGAGLALKPKKKPQQRGVGGRQQLQYQPMPDYGGAGDSM
jgi:hypothetical protein